MSFRDESAALERDKYTSEIKTLRVESWVGSKVFRWQNDETEIRWRIAGAQ
jgi:hypothetical protein